MSEPTASANAFVARIRANVDDYYDDKVDYDEFGRRQRSLWDEIKAAGKTVDEEVLRILRERK